MTDPNPDQAHLIVTRSNRGFAHLPPIPDQHGGEVRVYESSAATGPHIWLNVCGTPAIETAVHLTAEDAWHLADQLRALVRGHYQGDASPASDVDDDRTHRGHALALLELAWHLARPTGPAAVERCKTCGHGPMSTHTRRDGAVRCTQCPDGTCQPPPDDRSVTPWPTTT